MARHRRDIPLKEVVLPIGVMTRRWAPQTRYTIRRNIQQSIMKDFSGLI